MMMAMKDATIGKNKLKIKRIVIHNIKPTAAIIQGNCHVKLDENPFKKRIMPRWEHNTGCKQNNFSSTTASYINFKRRTT